MAVVTYTYIQNTKLVTNKFKSGGLHEKHVVATWNVGHYMLLMCVNCKYARLCISHKLQMWCKWGLLTYSTFLTYGVAVYIVEPSNLDITVSWTRVAKWVVLWQTIISQKRQVKNCNFIRGKTFLTVNIQFNDENKRKNINANFIFLLQIFIV